MVFSRTHPSNVDYGTYVPFINLSVLAFRGMRRHAGLISVCKRKTLLQKKEPNNTETGFPNIVWFVIDPYHNPTSVEPILVDRSLW